MRDREEVSPVSTRAIFPSEWWLYKRQTQEVTWQFPAKYEICTWQTLMGTMSTAYFIGSRQAEHWSQLFLQICPRIQVAWSSPGCSLSLILSVGSSITRLALPASDGQAWLRWTKLWYASSLRRVPGKNLEDRVANYRHAKSASV